MVETFSETRTDHRGVERTVAVDFSVVATGFSIASVMCPRTEAGQVAARGLRSWAEAAHFAEALARHGHPVEVVMHTRETITTSKAISAHRPADAARRGGL